MNSSTMSKDREKNLKKLAELMNTRHGNPYPIDEPLLNCLDHVLTPEETEFLIRMGTEPYTYESAASRSFLGEYEFKKFFERLARKGYVWPHDTDDGLQWYKLPGFMLGAFEVYLADGEETPEKKEFARRIHTLLGSFEKYNSFPLRGLFNSRIRQSKPQQSILIPGSAPAGETMRTVSVGKKIEPEAAKVYPARTVEELIEKHGDGQNIAVVHCFCRQYHKMIDEPCRFEHPPQSCIAIGSLSRFAVKHGTGRYLTKSEAIDLVHELQSKGAVHQVFHQDEDVDNPEIAICNCCWDCCGVFGSYNRGIIPLNLHVFFEAQLYDPALCTGCGACADYCPVQAVSVEDDICGIEREKCIGCGQCELQCRQEAIRMIANERTVFLPLRKKSEARIRK